MSFEKLMGISPHVEMIVRRLYWNKISRSQFTGSVLKKLKRKKTPQIEQVIDFDVIMEYLVSIGVQKGDIVIVHSNHSALKDSKLGPKQIIDKLLELVGPNGTLAMPVVRQYSEVPSGVEAITSDVGDVISTYNTMKTRIWTGLIPMTLLRRDDSFVSRFPLSSLAAVGAEAKDMMAGNIDGDLPTPNGINSAWNYCAKRNAWNIGLGVGLVHSLTMVHTAEDMKKYDWPVKNWYRERKFKIVDGDFQCEKTVLERHPKWGMLHFGERTLRRDLLRNSLMKSDLVEGVLIESVRSTPLMQYLNGRNHTGYPYFWVKAES